MTTSSEYRKILILPRSNKWVRVHSKIADCFSDCLFLWEKYFSIKYLSILLLKNKGHRSISIVANDLFPNQKLKLLICSSFNNKLTISFQFRVKNEASSSFHAVLICQHKPFFQWSFTWNGNDNDVVLVCYMHRRLRYQFLIMSLLSWMGLEP